MKSCANLFGVTDDLRTPVCVIGLGLIGGSLLRAAVASGAQAWGYNRSAAVVAAAEADGFEVTADLAEALGRASDRDALIVVAVPMPAVDGVLEAIARHAPGCGLTDVVSVKAPIADAVRRHGLGARYVGGHPMAGTAESGWAAADPDLFRDAAWVVGADDGADPDVWLQVAGLALACGAVVVPAESGEHDRAVARISHLPHLLAEALALAGVGGGDLALGLAAGSFRDGTRVAGTAPGLVRAMCEANAAALTDALDETLALLVAARAALIEGSTAELVDAGHAAHARYAEAQRQEITDIAPGSPGWLDRLRDAGRRGGVLTAIPPSINR